MKFRVTHTSATPGQPLANIGLTEEGETAGAGRTLNITVPLAEVSNYSLGAVFNVEIVQESKS